MAVAAQLPEFEYLQRKTLAEHGADVQIMPGGSDLLNQYEVPVGYAEVHEQLGNVPDFPLNPTIGTRLSPPSIFCTTGFAREVLWRTKNR